MTEKFSDDFEKQRETIHRNMLSSVSHDLKTPLASIIGSLEIYERLKDKLASEKKEALIATALQEAYRLDNFVTNILEMAKLENGMVKVQKSSCSFDMVLKDCLTKLGHRLKNSTVEIKSPGNDVVLMTDQALLSRAILQILDNAVKYGGSPSVIHIEYEIDTETKHFALRICDNGKGVPPNQYEAVFHKYTRFAKQDQQAAGTGLGLSITKEIMRLLGGTVTSDPRSSGGCFSLRLPI